jgi:hypothetical protein
MPAIVACLHYTSWRCNRSLRSAAEVLRGSPIQNGGTLDSHHHQSEGLERSHCRGTVQGRPVMFAVSRCLCCQDVVLMMASGARYRSSPVATGIGSEPNANVADGMRGPMWDTIDKHRIWQWRGSIGTMALLVFVSYAFLHDNPEYVQKLQVEHTTLPHQDQNKAEDLRPLEERFKIEIKKPFDNELVQQAFGNTRPVDIATLNIKYLGKDSITITGLIINDQPACIDEFWFQNQKVFPLRLEYGEDGAGFWEVEFQLICHPRKLVISTDKGDVTYQLNWQ